MVILFLLIFYCVIYKLKRNPVISIYWHDMYYPISDIRCNDRAMEDQCGAMDLSGELAVAGTVLRGYFPYCGNVAHNSTVFFS